MPGMSGFEVLDVLKSSEATRGIPVVVCTSRFLSDADKIQLSGKTVAILSKEGLGGSELAEVVCQLVRDRAATL
jgi:CheY-like chemotaxis protein